MKKVNVRHIADYVYCQRKAYLKFVMGEKEKINEEMALGHARHKIFEFLNKTERNIVSNITTKIDKEEIILLYKKFCFEISKKVYKKSPVKTFFSFESFFEEVWQDIEKEARIRAEVIYSFLERGIFGYALWHSLMPKYINEFKIIDEENGLVGIVDRINIIHENGKICYVPCELKNTMLKEKEKPFFSELIQIAAYSMLVEKKFSTSVEYGIIEYKNKSIKVKITEELIKKVLEIIEKIKNFSSLPKIQENFGKCKNCGVREACFSFNERILNFDLLQK